MSDQKMRVRFAPSPTGALHIGGVRTALYDYLLAKKHGGDFILRIEDTDQTRFVEGAEEYIIDALKWCGIVPTEGQGFGGDYGPYRQSERREIYQKYIQELLNSGHAYFAFDTAEDLDAMREKVKSEGKHTFQYDASTRMQMKNSLSMNEADVKELLENGTPYTIRFKMPDEREKVIVNDLIREEVIFATDELDDKVLMKSDGLPTYHLANVVDDKLMKITHVIRGEEWLPSTGLHVLMYRAFGWEDSMPKFAHLPLILKPSPESYLTKGNRNTLAERMTDEFFQKVEVNESYRANALAFIQQIFQDKKNVIAKLKISKKDDDNKRALKEFLKSNLSGKLSKRDGDRLGFPVFPLAWKGATEEDSFIGFKEIGFDPKAMNNFLVFLGWNPGTEQEIFSMDEMIEAFSLERVGKSGAKFDYDKARWFNQQYMLKSDDEAIAKNLRPLVDAKGWEASDDFLVSVARMMKERVHFTNEIIEDGYYFFQPVHSYDEKTIQKRWKAERRGLMDELVTMLNNAPTFEAVTLEQGVKDFMEKNELGFGDVFSILRVGISGTMKGPSVFEMMELLGKEEIINRMNVAYERFDEVVAEVG